MSGATDSLARKIAGAKDLGAVVRSMKALAASSIGQYEKAAEALEDYYRTVQLGLTACFKACPLPATTNRTGAASRAIGAVVFGSDQGLVGRFNEVMMEFTLRTIESVHGRAARVWAVGERMQELATDAGLSAPGGLSVPGSVRAIGPLVGQILIAVQTACEDGDVNEVYLFHNQPLSASAYEPATKRLLPLDHVWQHGLAVRPWPTRCLPELMEGAAPTLAAFIREYLFVVLFQACAQSLASENASRLAAMQRAEKNIEQVLEELNRTFHRVRQESIDEELFEVVAGYEALSNQRAPRFVRSEQKADAAADAGAAGKV
jgi:F-type H+-transporting ATPase subunit gamma